MKKIALIVLFVLILSTVCFAIDTVNERATITINISFYDKDSVLTIPTSFKYKIIDILSGTVIIDTTTVSPGTSVYGLVVPSASNAVLDNTKTFERRRLTVQWYNGAVLTGTAEYIYQIKNFNEVPFP